MGCSNAADPLAVDAACFEVLQGAAAGACKLACAVLGARMRVGRINFFQTNVRRAANEIMFKVLRMSLFNRL